MAAGLRYFSAGSYRILYRESEDGIEVVRVLDSARNLEALFAPKG